MCPLHLSILTPALWLCRHGCHMVIASRSLPRVSMVRGGPLLCPSRPWVAVETQSLGLEGPEAQRMLTPKATSVPNMELQLKWHPRDTLDFIKKLIIGSCEGALNVGWY